MALETESSETPSSEPVAPLIHVREMRALYRAAEERAARFRLLVEMGRDLTNIDNLDALLHLALERSTTFSGHDGGSVMLLLGSEGPLEVRASYGVDAVPPSTIVSDAATSLAWQAIQHQQPIIQEGPSPIRMTAPLDRPAVLSAICLPLIDVNGQTIGVLALKSTLRVRRLADDDLEALQLLASQLAAAIASAQLHDENARLFQAVAEREQQLEELVGRLLVAHEEERHRVAYDIHDGLAQVTVGVHQYLQSFAHQYHPRSSKARSDLSQALDLAQRAVQEARLVIGGLHPPALDDFGLAAALRIHVEMLCGDGWTITFKENLGSERLPAEVETILFRVAQEALMNVRKHAGTTHAQVTLERDCQGICLQIRDWGKGFELATIHEATRPGERVGLMSIQERITMLKGQWRIHSRPGEGTLIEVELNLPEYNT